MFHNLGNHCSPEEFIKVLKEKDIPLPQADQEDILLVALNPMKLNKIKIQDFFNL